METKERKEKLARFLNDSYLDFARERGIYTSLAEFAKWLDIPNTSLSQYMNMVRLPSGKNVYKMGDKLGPPIYEILGLPMMVPDNEGAKFIISHWHELDEEAQEKFVQILKMELEEKSKPSALKKFEGAVNGEKLLPT